MQETEYTGAGKHLIPQLNFAKDNGIEVYVGDPKEQVPGKNIVIPSHPSIVSVTDLDMDGLKNSYMKNAINKLTENKVEQVDIEFLSTRNKT